MRFAKHGVDGIGLADLMKELGLTHGGEYKHFASCEPRDAIAALAGDALRKGAKKARLAFDA